MDGERNQDADAGLLRNLSAKKDGFYFGGGGVKYSTDFGGGRVDAIVKAGLLGVNWNDGKNEVSAQADTKGSVNLKYKRNF